MATKPRTLADVIGRHELEWLGIPDRPIPETDIAGFVARIYKAYALPSKPPQVQAPADKGKPGRRGYPLTALEYAKKLRKKNPEMKAHTIRKKCWKSSRKMTCLPMGNHFVVG